MEYTNIFLSRAGLTAIKMFSICILFSLVSCITIDSLSAQEACPIYTAIETRPTFKERSANIYNQTIPPITQSWDSLSNISSSNDKYARVYLGRFERAGIVKGNSLNLRLPTEAMISGIEVIVEGRSTGEGKVRDISMQLLDTNGEASGVSLGETGGAKAWLNGETDHSWSYGGENETWGLDLTAEMLNDPNFGFQLQIRNSLRDDIEVLIDHIIIKVYYEPLYSFCDHTCVTFYVDSLQGPVTYNWYIPQGFELLSLSEKEGIINIGVSYATFGTYEICVESLTYGNVTGECCRRFNYENCINATIGDQVWNDINRNAIFDAGDEPIEGATVELFDGGGNLQATVLSDEDGKYLFDGLAVGDYYVKVDPPQGFTTVFPNIGNETIDSDITGAYGPYTSDIITIDSETDIDNIDIGLSEFIFIGDLVWEDDNGDGIKDEDESGLSDVNITILNGSEIVLTGVSGTDGKYLLGPLPQGDYEVVFDALEGFNATLQKEGLDDTVDSDVDATGSTGVIVFDEPGLKDDIDAGFYQASTIGNFVWEDLNNDGIQDEDEPGLSGVIVNLVNSGEAIQSTVTDLDGLYQFVVSPGSYTIEIMVEGVLQPTLLMIGDPLFDSDLLLQDGVLTTELIAVSSGEDRNDIDLGLYNAPSSIGGLTWLDVDSDGQLDADEEKLSGVIVDLYLESGTLVESTTTDENGNYLFDLLPSAVYYLVFDLDEDKLFTVADTGTNDIDSDVTNSIQVGSTELINLAPGVDELNFYAGYAEKADVGDMVWLDINRNGLFDVGESGVVDVPVLLINSGGEAIEITSTDSDGNYQFSNVYPGTYTVEFEISNELNFTQANEGTDDEIDSDVTVVSIGDEIIVGATELFTVAANDIITSVDAGVLLSLGGISGSVFLDSDEDGDSVDEVFLGGILVGLLDDQQMLISSTTTGANGEYSFSDLDAGSYSVMFEITDRYNFTVANVASDDIDSDVTGGQGNGTTDLIEVEDGVLIENVDAGFVDGISDISGVAWIDKNGDGIRSNDEDSFIDILILLHNAFDNSIVSTTETDESGNYLFENVDAGSYYIEIASELIATNADQGGDDTIDSDVTGSNGDGTTDVFDHLYFENTTSVDGGYYELATIGDYIWEDLNANGLQDDDEPGLEGVLLNLYQDGERIFFRNSSENGFYQFTVPPGNYTVEIVADGFISTIPVAGDVTLDSDFYNTGNGILTESIDLMSGEQKLNVDGGLIPAYGSLGGEIFVDADENGIDENELNLEGIEVNLFDESQTLIKTTLSDGEGNYLFEDLDPGNYYVVFNISERYLFTLPNIGSLDTDSDVTEDLSTGSTSLITVSNGDNIEYIDAGVIDGASKISGTAWIDADGDGIRTDDEQLLSGVDVKLYSVFGMLIDSTETNSQGSYCLSEVDTGQFFIVFTPEDEQYIITLFDQGSNDTIDSDVTGAFLPGSTTTLSTAYFTNIENVDAGYYQYSTIGDQVWIDANENNVKEIDEVGLDGVTVNLLDTDGMVIVSTVTAPGGGLDSGFYQLQNIPPGLYSIQFILPDFYDFVVGDVGSDSEDSDVIVIDGDIGETDQITIASGDINNTYDAGVFFNKSFTAILAGTIWIDSNADGLSTGEPPLDGRQVTLYAEDGTIVSTMLTDIDGNYRFEMLAEGRYYMEVDLVDGQLATVPNVGSDDNIDSEFTDAQGPGTSGLIDLENEQQELQYDLGVVNDLSVGDLVWDDLNVNGQFDEGELGVEGVTVIIQSTVGDLIDSTLTDVAGLYLFENLPSFTYKLTFRAPDGTTFTSQNIGAIETDSDADDLGCTVDLDLTAGGRNEDVDAGLLYDATIGGIAWVDFNANGQQNNVEPGLNDVLVSLYHESGLLVSTTTTGSTTIGEGGYSFAGVVPGNYYLEFQVPAEYSITDPDRGSDATDSDVTGSQGALGSTDIFSVVSGEIITDIYAGLFLPASLGDRVFLDTNMDGIQDTDEGGVEGVEVILYRSFGLPVDTVITDVDGFYRFENLKQGLYFIEFTIPQNFVVSPIDVSNDEDTDSDADDTGTTPLISLAHGATLLSIDMGLFADETSLRSIVWEDENADGIRQTDEARLRDIKVELINEEGVVIDSTWSNHRGKYAFQQLDSGNYYIHIGTEDIEYILTEPNTGDDMNDSDILLSGNSDMFSVEGILSVPNVDAGLISPSMLAIEIWEEIDIDGMYGPDEAPLDGIMAELIDASGVVHNMNMSVDGTSENVIFEKVRPGQYYIRYSNDYNYVGSVNANSELIDPDNSDVLDQGSYFVSPMFEVGIDDFIDYVDAGFYIDPEGLKANIPTQQKSEENGLDFNIGPNPAIYYIELSDLNKSLDKNYEIKVVDREGKVSFKTTVRNPQNYRVPLDELKSGTYYLIVTDGKEVLTRKLLKITP